MSSPTMKNFKIAFFSALLVLAVAYPVLGLKLSTIGIKLQVEGASPAALWTIGGCAIAMFFWQLFRDQVRAAWSHAPKLPSMPGKASEFLTLPSTQRWVVLALIVVALAWPFFGSRGAVDIATLILIYVMLGLGLNIVVGLAGLLDLVKQRDSDGYAYDTAEASFELLVRREGDAAGLAGHDLDVVVAGERLDRLRQLDRARLEQDDPRARTADPLRQLGDAQRRQAVEKARIGHGVLTGRGPEPAPACG